MSMNLLRNLRLEKPWFWKIVSAIELTAAVCVIALDLFIPTIVILGLILVSHLVRGEKMSVLGFKQCKKSFQMTLGILLMVIIWTLLQLSLFMPVLNHLTGTTQNLSAFEKLKGNPGNLLFFLTLTWTLAAFGEEIVYRGYLQNKFFELFGTNKAGIFIAIGGSSLLFGLAHTEQGIIGISVTVLDAIFFSFLKLKYGNNLWAPVLAHGFSNSLGLTAFFFVGPIYGFW